MLVAGRARSGDGVLAAVALAELADGALPRRSRVGKVPAPSAPAPVITLGLPERTWARDVETMRRLLAGLRGLS